MSASNVPPKSNVFDPGSSAHSTSRWTRSADSNPPFNGPGRGKARGRGRGGASRNGHNAHLHKDPKLSIHITSSRDDSAKPSPIGSTKPSSPVVPQAEKSPILSATATLSSKPSSRSKNASRHSSRPNLSTNIASNTTTTDAPQTPRSRNKQRRSYNNKPAAPVPPVPPKSIIPADESLLQPPKPTYMKDTPPHLATFDLRSNIDALVERVRAVAMAEHRPSTPGSHIDWAGDDDDSLPDLDDWGITTTKSNLMSPIIVDGLTALPDHAVPPTQTSLPPSQQPAPVNKPEPNLNDKPELTLSDAAIAPDNTAKETTASPIQERDTSSPSAPSLPIVNIQQEEQFPDSDEVGFVLVGKTDGASAANSPTFSISTPERGLRESIHAPRPDGDSEDIDKGLQSSMHAPTGQFSPLNSPPHWAGIRSNSKHVRAHTVGKTPHDFPTGNHNGRHGRSGMLSPRDAVRQSMHMRTHSSPPTNGQTHPRARPVLTGDAISRLARSIVATNRPASTPVANTDV